MGEQLELKDEHELELPYTGFPSYTKKDKEREKNEMKYISKSMPKTLHLFSRGTPPTQSDYRRLMEYCRRLTPGTTGTDTVVDLSTPIEGTPPDFMKPLDDDKPHLNYCHILEIALACAEKGSACDPNEKAKVTTSLTKLEGATGGPVTAALSNVLTRYRARTTARRAIFSYFNAVLTLQTTKNADPPGTYLMGEAKTRSMGYDLGNCVDILRSAIGVPNELWQQVLWCNYFYTLKLNEVAMAAYPGEILPLASVKEIGQMRHKLSAYGKACLVPNPRARIGEPVYSAKCYLDGAIVLGSNGSDSVYMASDSKWIVVRDQNIQAKLKVVLDKEMASSSNDYTAYESQIKKALIKLREDPNRTIEHLFPAMT